MIVRLVAAIAITTLTEGLPGLERQAVRTNPTVEVSNAVFKGKQAVRALDVAGKRDLDPLVRLEGSSFKDGTIEAEVAGMPAPGAPSDVRGFIGIAFRVQTNPSRYEAFYIRPTNGRAEDQLRRNHATQYISPPEFPWQRLRNESPGVYESYADMISGEWTKLKIEVSGRKARLYVNGAEQPALIVNDLKHGADASGGIALWVGTGTEGYFRNIRVTQAAD